MYRHLDEDEQVQLLQHFPGGGEAASETLPLIRTTKKGAGLLQELEDWLRCPTRSLIRDQTLMNAADAQMHTYTAVEINRCIQLFHTRLAQFAPHHSDEELVQLLLEESKEAETESICDLLQRYDDSEDVLSRLERGVGLPTGALQRNNQVVELITQFHKGQPPVDAFSLRQELQTVIWQEEKKAGD